MTFSTHNPPNFCYSKKIIMDKVEAYIGKVETFLQKYPSLFMYGKRPLSLSNIYF